MLNDFFRINMPYGIAKNENGDWMAFNREYLPIGFNENVKGFDINETSKYPVHTNYKRISDKTLLKLAWDDASGVKRNDTGDIITVFLYNDGTNPVNQSSVKEENKYWEVYFDKIKLLSKFKR